MNFDPNNQFYAQLFRNRYDLITNERKNEINAIRNSNDASNITNLYPPFEMFCAANELQREKVLIQNFDEFKNANSTQETKNLIRLKQTSDILKSVVKRNDTEKVEIIKLNSKLFDDGS